MDQKRKLEVATKQLDRVLTFFPRVETKASFLFGMNTAVLGAMAVNLRISDFYIWYFVVPAALAFFCIVGSLYFVYHCMFPHLKGGARSLIYFREIAARTEADYVDEFLKQDDEKHARDLLGQVWRNSEILKIKFDSMRIAFILIILALIPWTIFLVTAALSHSTGVTLR
jgi:hypothetical protein